MYHVFFFDFSDSATSAACDGVGFGDFVVNVDVASWMLSFSVVIKLVCAEFCQC